MTDEDPTRLSARRAAAEQDTQPEQTVRSERREADPDRTRASRRRMAAGDTQPAAAPASPDEPDDLCAPEDADAPDGRAGGFGGEAHYYYPRSRRSASLAPREPRDGQGAPDSGAAGVIDPASRAHRDAALQRRRAGRIVAVGALGVAALAAAAVGVAALL